MKDENNNSPKMKGELKTEIEMKNQPVQVTDKSKSGGNAPSDLGSVGRNAIGSASNANARSTINTPQMNGLRQPNNNPMSNTSSGASPSGGSTSSPNGNASKKSKKETKGKKKEENKQSQKEQAKDSYTNPKNTNPLLNQNKMKNFGKNQKADIPKVNSSASFMEKAKGFFGGKGKIPHLPGSGLLSSLSRKMPDKNSAVDKYLNKKKVYGIAEIWAAIPIHIKIAILGGSAALLLLLIVLIIAVATKTSAADANREMKKNFIQGNYTEGELCEYLDRNGYIALDDEEAIACEDTPAYQFFTNFKELMEEYEKTYARYRFKINVELLYETLAYSYSDEELYQKTTKEEMKKLMDAMLEKIEESCVIKEYDEKKKICTEVKYVYNLYEFSLNKYISYLKYGTTSMHPNYGNDKTNTSRDGKSVTRICGEGKNTDYIFGFGLVNTSSSPLGESSDCPGNPVKEEDYEKLKPTWVTLDELGLFGGVPYFEHVYEKDDKTQLPKIENDQESSNETSKNVVISPSHQTGNPYTGVTLSEKTSMYNLASYLKSELESRGYNVFVVPENDGTHKYNASHTQAGVNWLGNNTGVYIALHSNATGKGGGAYGPTALYNPGSSESKNFTNIVCDHMKKLYASSGRKNTVSSCAVDTGSRSEVKNFYSLGGSGAATLVEVGFHDNEDEARWIVNNYSKIAGTLANAIDQYVGN